MYKPHFTITPKITKNIEEIGVVFGYFKSISLPEEYRKEYITTVITDTVHSSTAIEGNKLTNTQVKEVISGKKIKAYEKDIQEVKNYYKAVKLIVKIGKESNKPITEKIIFNIHKIILAGTDKKRIGAYRNTPIYVGDYLPPEHQKVPQLMEEFAEWLNNPFPKDLSPILYAGITHQRFVAIHPFVDGNGRTGRILTKLILIRYGYDITKVFSLESYYNRNRMNYYSALSNVDKYRVDGKENLTSWLEYFTEGMLIEAKRAQSRIEELMKQASAIRKPVNLNENQKKILQYLIKEKTIKTQDYITLSGLSRKGAYNGLEKLVKWRIIKRQGIRKATFYILTNEGFKYI